MPPNAALGRVLADFARVEVHDREVIALLEHAPVFDLSDRGGYQRDPLCAVLRQVMSEGLIFG